jgi:hypothetical protein
MMSKATAVKLLDGATERGHVRGFQKTTPQTCRRSEFASNFQYLTLPAGSTPVRISHYSEPHEWR